MLYSVSNVGIMWIVETVQGEEKGGAENAMWYGIYTSSGAKTRRRSGVGKDRLATFSLFRDNYKDHIF